MQFVNTNEGNHMSSGKQVCILLVEDNEDALRAMSLLLERCGFSVLSARNYEEAMALTGGGKCDLLISDVVLEGRSGLELMQEMKGRYGLKGIAVSSHVSPHRKLAAMAAGFDRFVPKPFDFDLLLKAIEELTSSNPVTLQESWPDAHRPA
jgi:CheY-like chemotaxis protein